MSGKILKDYVSEIDLLLENFDKEHPTPSLSQRKEIDKYRKVYFLRDEDNRPTPKKDIWEGF